MHPSGSPGSHGSPNSRHPLRIRLGLQSLLILGSLLSISAMIAGLFISGVWIGEPSTSNHRLALLPFILASSMAPIGVPLAIYWVLRVVHTFQRPS